MATVDKQEVVTMQELLVSSLITELAWAGSAEVYGA